MFDWRRGEPGSGRTLAAGAARGPSPRYWLIAKNDEGRMATLTTYFDGHETIPVFSFREEAELFVRLGRWKGWRVRETSAGELASLLFGPYSYVKMLALDPLPEIFDEGMTRLVSVRSIDFAQRLLGDRGLPPPLVRRPSGTHTRRY